MILVLAGILSFLLGCAGRVVYRYRLQPVSSYSMTWEAYSTFSVTESREVTKLSLWQSAKGLPDAVSTAWKDDPFSCIVSGLFLFLGVISFPFSLTPFPPVRK